MTNPPSHKAPITLAERIATAVVSALAAAITLFCYFLFNLALASKAPSGPPVWLLDLLTSKLSLGLVLIATVAGFSLGSSRMAEVFSVFWGTSELWQESWFNRLMAGIAVVVVVAVLAHLVHTGAISA